MRLENVPKSYDRAALWYDPLTEIVFGRLLRVERFRERAIHALGDIDGATVLDIGCGTGRNFPFLVHRVGRQGRVLGIDYSAGMLARARKRVDAHRWSNVELVRGDAAMLDDLPESVDAVISVWCMGIVYDIEAALERAVAILRPGGPIAIVDFEKARPDEGWLRALYPVYRRALICAGIDTAEDLDDAKLRAKWRRGREILRSRLCHLREVSYLDGAGVMFTGRKPARGTT